MRRVWWEPPEQASESRVTLESSEEGGFLPKRVPGLSLWPSGGWGPWKLEEGDRSRAAVG